MTSGASTVSIETLIWLSSIVLALLIATILLTMGRSLITARRRARVDNVRPSIRGEFFQQLQSPSDTPEEWIAGLSTAERRALRELVEEVLQQFRGGKRKTVQEIARALGLEDRAYRAFNAGKRHERLQGLYWFWLLDSPVDRERLLERSKGQKDTEAAAARVLVTNEADGMTDRATDLLLERGQSLSVMGMDVLYELHKTDPMVLFEHAGTDTSDWSNSLLIQVFEVIAHCEPIGSDISLDWIIENTTHPSADVRVAAFTALSNYGWREDVRQLVDWGRAVHDPSPKVRNVVYAVLGRWDDGTSSIAVDALPDDPDARSRVAGIASLYDHVEMDREDTHSDIHEDLEWVEQIRAFG